MPLDPELIKHYQKNKDKIKLRLLEFKQIKRENYFYELCFCICTPQSKAKSALQVQNKLQSLDFYNKRFNPVELLNSPLHYIRFHNQKSERLIKAIDYFPDVLAILDSNFSTIEKRNTLQKVVNGFGMKEASHFMRNIGYEGLAILDRHILKNLVNNGIFKKLPQINTKNNYLETEKIFNDFAKDIDIPIDELDLLFWSYENGEIIK
mgnify:CR=1 FL=1